MQAAEVVGLIFVQAEVEVVFDCVVAGWEISESAPYLRRAHLRTATSTSPKSPEGQIPPSPGPLDEKAAPGK